MTLDDVIKGEIKRFGNHVSIFENLKARIEAGKGFSDDGNVDRELARLIVLYNGDTSPEEITTLIEEASQESLNEMAGKFFNKAFKNSKSGLVELVEPNYLPILEEIDLKGMYGVLLKSPAYSGEGEEFGEIGKAHKEFKTFEKINAKKDIKAYIGSSKNDAVKLLLEKNKDNKELMEKLISTRTKIQAQKFTNYFITEPTKVKSEEDIEKYFNKDLAVAYLSGVQGSAEEKDQKELYSQIGVGYSDDLTRSEISKRNKAAEKALKAA